jgi:hypothetical protein
VAAEEQLDVRVDRFLAHRRDGVRRGTAVPPGDEEAALGQPLDRGAGAGGGHVEETQERDECR